MAEARVVIPFAGECPHRRRALDHVAARYPWPVTVAPGGEPWIKAQAVMPAVEAADAEIVVVADADVWSDGTAAAVEAVAAGAPWAIPHRGVFRLTESATDALIAGAPLEGLDLDERAYLGWEGGGIVVARRETLLDVPMDPRFIGWGCEDEAWALALNLLAGHRWRGRSQLAHLWHPPQQREDRRQGSRANFALLRRYVAARLDPAAMRSLLDEVNRDDRQADQPPLHDHAGHHLR